MPLTGRWRIVEMDLWDQEAIDLVEPGFIEFGDDGTGEFGFIVVRGWMDCRPGERDRRGGVEFSWLGTDEGDEVSGRGWAALADDGSLQGTCTSISATTPASAPCASGRSHRPRASPGRLDEPGIPRPFNDQLGLRHGPSRLVVTSCWCADGKLRCVELLIAVNPDADSRLPFLMRLPLAGGMVFRTSGTWPRTTALYCYPVSADEWPAEPDIVERVGLRSCVRRGAAIDLVLDRGRENRSQLVFTKARGRDAVFWQSPRTRKQARPNVRTPTARAAGIPDLEIVVDSHEQYPYRFAGQQAMLLKRALPCGDYGLVHGGRLIASVERKSLADLAASLTRGKLRYALAELAALPRAAVVIEDRYSSIFKLDRPRPAMVADGLAEVQVRWPNVPIVFCETRQLAEEWTYRFLAAAQAWAETEAAAPGRFIPAAEETGFDEAPAAPEPATAEVRAWAGRHGIAVPDRGKLRREVWDAWRTAHRADGELSGTAPSGARR